MGARAGGRVDGEHLPDPEPVQAVVHRLTGHVDHRATHRVDLGQRIHQRRRDRARVDPGQAEDRQQVPVLQIDPRAGAVAQQPAGPVLIGQHDLVGARVPARPGILAGDDARGRDARAPTLGVGHLVTHRPRQGGRRTGVAVGGQRGRCPGDAEQSAPLRSRDVGVAHGAGLGGLTQHEPRRREVVDGVDGLAGADVHLPGVPPHHDRRGVDVRGGVEQRQNGGPGDPDHGADHTHRQPGGLAFEGVVQHPDIAGDHGVSGPAGEETMPVHLRPCRRLERHGPGSLP